ncbi:MAG: hypothetical protein MOGMAGMI_01962 [Candidatus Omnitrophica bacterium]|nr:hypothetical protein [Candidatus Omnitrophota bacterium]
MLLWNTTKATLESKFDGRISIFKPGERKRFHDRIEGQHLLFKLSPKGMVELPDTDDMMAAKLDSKELEPFLINGLKARRKTLDGVVQNFRVKNKEREAAKLASEPPDDHVINCVKEIKAIDETMKSLKADDYNLVDDYLGKKADVVKDTDQEIKDSQAGVERDGASGYKMTGKNGHSKGGQKPAKAKAGR